MIFGIRYLAAGVPSIAIGWLIAERNAVDSRIKMWPTFSQYIDWQRVEKDLADGGPHST